MRRSRSTLPASAIGLLLMAGCAGDSGPGTPALVLLDSLAALDNGLVTSPVYIGPDLVVGAGMSPLSTNERHWVIRRDDSGRWAVTDEYEHRPAAVRFAAAGERRSGATSTAPGNGPHGPPEDGGDGSSSGEPASAVLAVLDGWGLVRPRLALVGGYWEPITTAEGFDRLAGDATGRRLFRAEDGGARHWSLLRPDPEADPTAVGLREVVTGTAAAFPGGSEGPSQGWALMSDQPGTEVALAQPAITGVLSPAELPLVPATGVPEEGPLGRTLLDSLAATVDGWSGSAPFLPSGMHRVPGPGGRDWVFVRASRPGARTCETELLEGWVRADRPDRLHQAVRGSTECGGPGWPASRPLGALQSGDRHFAISLEGEGPTARIGITELFETSVGSRRGGAAQLAEAPTDEGAVPGAEASTNAWTAWPIVLSYIQPTALEGVPESIRNELESAGCLIPTLQWGRQNVVRGSFAAPGQEDWAVLCSRDGVSEIRLFWGGQARCPQPVAPSPDRQWLQDRGDSTAVLGRTVGRYTPDEVDRWLDYYELDPGIEFTHDVLLDTREGKPVTGFRYCSGGVWITEG